MTSKTLYLTLTLCAATSFVLILLINVLLFGGGPLDRINYAVLVSVSPAFPSLAVIKLTSVIQSWLGVATLYFMFFVWFVVVLGVVG